ncbi:MAG: tripartite tricarboxylate transporter permease [Desulfatiglandales bacterium]|nr:tripartite tricarboxylate transporter permease [Desulfatiglandales bacterium]
MFEAFISAVGMLSHTNTLFFVVLGTIIGLVFGLLPGLGGVSALALVLPLTYGINPLVAMFFLAAVMGAVPFGGSISAILLNTPGTPQSGATTLDGHPMAKRGEASRALGISATASGLGAVFGLVVLMLLIPLVRKVVMFFGPPEFFIIVIFGLATVSLAARGNMLKGLFTGCLGILFSFIGFSSVFGTLRFSLGSNYLWEGIALVPFLIGVFAIAELIDYSLRGGRIASEKTLLAGSVLQGVRDVFRYKICFLRSSVIGTVIGIIPGVGGAVANFVSYIVAKENSKNRETFGTGEVEGVLAAESSNNAKDGGSLLPTLGFGIPGSSEMAVLLGAFMLHGLVPGPLMLKEHLDVLLAIVLGLLLSNIIVSIVGLLAAKHLAKITLIDVQFIVPVVIVLCFVGSYALRGNIWDVMIALVAGIFGYGLRRFGFSTICLVIGFILGVLGERAFHQSLLMAYGSYKIFITRTASLILILLLISALLFPFVKMVFAKRGKE